MASIQDIETRLASLEDKVKFTMEVVSVVIGIGHPLAPNRQQVQLTVKKLYDEVKYAGGQIIDVMVEKPAGPADPSAAGSEVGTDTRGADYTLTNLGPEPTNDDPHAPAAVRAASV